MKIIGITGGVGAGKSTALRYLKKRCRCRILMADDVANALKEPGEVCYGPLTALLGKEVLRSDGRIDRGKMAEKIFRDEKLLKEVNGIVHPAVNAYIAEEIKKAGEAGADYFFLEAALLLENGYDRIVDEMWYIFAREEVRRQRLKDNRGYTEEKIDRIFRAQMTDETYRSRCRTVIDNSGGPEQTYLQIEKELRG